MNVEHCGVSVSKPYIEALNCYKAKVYQWSTVTSQAQEDLSVNFLQKGTVTIAEIAWHVIEWYTKEWGHFSYLSSYITICACMHTGGTHAPAAYSGVAAHTTTIPCTIGHSAHSSCPSWLSFLSIIFQAQFGASCLAGCQLEKPKVKVSGHSTQAVYVTTQGLSVYCLLKGTITVAENSL